MKAFTNIKNPAGAIYAFAVICQQAIEKETLSPKIKITHWAEIMDCSRPKVQKSFEELESVGLIEFYDEVVTKGIKPNRFIMLTQRGIDAAKELSDMFAAASQISAINIAAGLPSDWCMARHAYKESPLAKVCPDSF